MYVQLPVNLSKQGCSTADLKHGRVIFLLLFFNSLPFIFCLKWHTHTHSRQQGRSETEEYSSDSESESEDEEELQMILEDLQKQNEELEVRRKDMKICSKFKFNWPFAEAYPL